MASFATFTERLRYSLDKSMWTQRELANYCHVQEGLVSKWLNGTHKPSNKNMIVIGAALDCSPQWLKTAKGSKDEKFDIAKYSPQIEKKIKVEKSPFGGYDFTINITDEEMKEIIMSGIK